MGLFGGVGGLVRKTSNLSPCPVPLVVKLDITRQGSAEDRRLCSRIWYKVERWIQRHTARGAQTHPHLQIHLVTTSGIITTAGKNQWLTQKEAVNVEILYTNRARRGELYA